MNEETDNSAVEEIVAKLSTRPEIFEKLNSGDTSALTEMFEYLGAKTFASEVRVLKQ
jgi:hypothetical protein